MCELSPDETDNVVSDLSRSEKLKESLRDEVLAPVLGMMFAASISLLAALLPQTTGLEDAAVAAALVTFGAVGGWWSA